MVLFCFCLKEEHFRGEKRIRTGNSLSFLERKKNDWTIILKNITLTGINNIHFGPIKEKLSPQTCSDAYKRYNSCSNGDPDEKGCLFCLVSTQGAGSNSFNPPQ